MTTDEHRLDWYAKNPMKVQFAQGLLNGPSSWGAHLKHGTQIGLSLREAIDAAMADEVPCVRCETPGACREYGRCFS